MHEYNPNRNNDYDINHNRTHNIHNDTSIRTISRFNRRKNGIRWNQCKRKMYREKHSKYENMSTLPITIDIGTGFTIYTNYRLKYKQLPFL